MIEAKQNFEYCYMKRGTSYIVSCLVESETTIKENMLLKQVTNLSCSPEG